MKGTQSPLLLSHDVSRAGTAAYPKSASLDGKVPPPTPRNMTGIYLGLDSGGPPVRSRQGTTPPSGGSGKLVPPLARGRGVAMRIRTPTEQRRYKMVENLRSQKEETLKVKEERRTGLHGNPLKPHQRKNRIANHQVVDESSTRLLGSLPSQTDIQELTRRNPREYSFVTNQGVSHPEYLRYSDVSKVTPDPHQPPDVFSVSLHETVAHEVDRVTKTRDLIGLEECYKKICKSNINSLHSLLPQRKQQQARKDRQQRNTGLTIKSYRNPSQGEIIAQFPNEDGFGSPRAKTSLGRAIVPQPYFFKMYAQPQRSNSSPARMKKSPFEEQFNSLQGSSKILAVPGAGFLSQSASRGRQMNSPCGLTSPGDTEDLADNLRKDMFIDSSQPITNNESSETVAVPLPDVVDDNRSEITTVTDNGADDQNKNKTDQYKNSNMNDVKPVETNNNSETIAQTMETTENMNNDNDTIGLVLENEEGSQDVLDIDEADEVIATSPAPGDEPEKDVGVLQRRTSIQERLMKMKSSESLVESIKSDCESRRREFEDLIEEHAQIIEEITSIKESASIETDLNDLVNGGSQT